MADDGPDTFTHRGRLVTVRRDRGGWYATSDAGDAAHEPSRAEVVATIRWAIDTDLDVTSKERKRMRKEQDP